jgi:hypothetical protein
MAALERDLQRVLSDQRHVPDAQLVGAEAPDARQPARCTRFASTLGAWTRPPQLLSRVHRLPAVFPRDLHDLTLAIDVDGGGKRIGVLQRR